MRIWKGRCSLVASRRIPYEPAERWGHPARPLRTLTLLRAPLHAGERWVRQDARRGASRATSDGAAPPDSLRSGKNREFLTLPTISVRRFALQSQCLAHDSLFFARTGNSFGRTGNFIRRNSGSPIPLGGFGSRIPLAMFPPKRGGRR